VFAVTVTAMPAVDQASAARSSGPEQAVRGGRGNGVKIVRTHHLVSVTIVAAVFIFALAEQAFADAGTLAAVAEWVPARVLLGLGGVVVAAVLTRGEIG
jgi:hypothetical protein